MQYTTKLALLAVAFGATTALAGPLTARSLDDQLKVPELDADLSSREFHGLEARAYPQLDARSIGIVDWAHKHVLTKWAKHHQQEGDCEHVLFHLKATKEQEKILRDPIAFEQALADDENPLHKVAEHILEVALAGAQFREFPPLLPLALFDKYHPLHSIAVQLELAKSAKFLEALINKSNPLHRAAKGLQNHLKVEVYLSDKKHYKDALHNKDDKHHEDAVLKYLSNEVHFDYALSHKHSEHHKIALRLYFSNPMNFIRVLSEKGSPFHKAAVHFKHHKKHQRCHHHHKVVEGSKGDHKKPAEHHNGPETVSTVIKTVQVIQSTKKHDDKHQHDEKHH